MQIEQFKREFEELNGVYAIPDKVVLTREPLELLDLATNQVIASFDSLDDALAFEINGKTLEQRVADWTEITFKRDGGMGWQLRVVNILFRPCVRWWRWE